LSEIGLALNIALPLVSSLLYAVFILWFVSKNKKIDVYVQPRIFKWPVKTILLILGTAFTVLLFQPGILIGALLGQTIEPITQFAFIELIYLSMVLFVVLFGLVVWPGMFLLIMLFLSLMLTNTTAQMFYYSYVFLGMIPIYLSLLASSRQAVDTLILRIKEAGNFQVASHLEEKGRIGPLGFILGMMGPALPVRWLRRGTKVGAVKITLSVNVRDRASTRYITEKYTTVTLERMNNNTEEVKNRIGNTADKISGENTDF